MIADLVSAIAEARAKQLDEQLTALATGRAVQSWPWDANGRPIPDDDTDEDEPEGR